MVIRDNAWKCIVLVIEKPNKQLVHGNAYGNAWQRVVMCCVGNKKAIYYKTISMATHMVMRGNTLL
jgi:hypothetical protein